MRAFFTSAAAGALLIEGLFGSYSHGLGLVVAGVALGVAAMLTDQQ